MFHYEGTGDGQEVVDNKPLMDGPVKLSLPKLQGEEDQEGVEVATSAGRLITMNKAGEKAKIEYVANEERMDKVKAERREHTKGLGLDPDNVRIKVGEDYDREEEIQEAIAEGRDVSDLELSDMNEDEKKMFEEAQEEKVAEEELDREPIYRPVKYKFPPPRNANGDVQDPEVERDPGDYDYVDLNSITHRQDTFEGDARSFDRLKFKNTWIPDERGIANIETRMEAF